ncbi:hypothetical protein PR048_001984 [Dryococelus australis]|uniref:KEN domain-containing protein n=1 Tax=Dryococelus australis TaxID=614101 RepID=A0ABQ9IIV9_9NEOP|nr:hypothetical protein PR048_001984 [Dryococelus australis]
MSVLQKHHYRELSQEAQRSLGEVPCGFVQYWTMRFPLLVLHSWLAMQCIRAEPVFAQYYQDEYVFQGTAPAATTFSTTNTSRPRSKSPVEALSWRRQDDPVRCQYLVSAPKWSSRRVAELKLESSRAHACGSDTDLSSLALLDANNMDAKLSRDCTKLNKRKGHKKKTPDVPLAWKLQSEVT